MELKSAICIVYLILISGFLVVDAFIKDKAMEENKNLVELLRENRSDFLDYFFISFTSIAYPETALITILLFFYFSRDKMNSISYITSIAFCSYLNSVLKIIYAEPRPYWLFSTMPYIYKCEKGMGHPSGHAMVGIIYFVLLVDWLLYEVDFGKKRLIDLDVSIITQVENKPKREKWHTLLYIIAFVLTIMVGISRVYLGVHTYEQVLSGWAYGSIYLIFHYYYGKSLFYGLIKEIGENKNFLGFNGAFAIFLVNFISLLFIVIPIVFFVFLENDANRNRYSKVILGICKKTGYFIYDRKALLDCGLFAFFFGLLNGAFFSKGEIDEYHIYGKEKSTISFFKKVFRFLILAFFFALTILLINLFKLTEQIYVAYIFGAWFNFFFFGFAVSYIIPLIHHKFSLTYAGDYMKIINYDMK